jgi:hypothetical protein
LDSESSSPWVSKLDGFNSSSRDDDAHLLELAVVLFFLVDILGFLLEPNMNGGLQLLCYAKALTQTMKGMKGLKLSNSIEYQRKTKSYLSTV